MSRPIDPRLLKAAPAARRLLVGYGGLQAAAAALTVAQAVVLGTAVARVVHLDRASSLVSALVLLAAIMVARALLASCQEWFGARGSLRVRAELRHGVLDSVRRLGPVWAQAQPAGRLATAAGPGLESLDGYLSRALPALVGAAVVPAAVLGWITLTDWRTGLILLVILPLVPLFMALVGVTTGRRMQRQYEILSRLSGQFLDLVAGLTTLRVYGRAAHQAETVRRATDNYRRHTMATLRTAFLSGFVLDLLATLSIAVVAVDIGLRLDHGHLPLSTALIVLLLAPELFAPLRAMGAQHHTTEEGRTAADAALAVLAEAADLPAAEPVSSPLVSDGSVRLNSISIWHPGRDDAAVKNLTLAIEAGEVVAIQGRSGAGKSTVLSSLLGFVHPTRGSISIGRDGRCPPLDSPAWRDNLAWVPQRPQATQATVAAEVRLGDPLATDAAVDDVIAACHAPHPSTDLGEAGRHISAGQLRRVALARALLRARRQISRGSTPLVLLDEPSEDLDRLTEDVVAGVITALRGRATVVVATHSAKLVASADRVVELHDGSLLSDERRTAVAVHVAPLPPVAPAIAPLSTPPAPGAGSIRAVLPVRRTVRALAAGGALSGLAGLCGLALTATSIWLICRAAQHPNVQALEIAVVGVRTFALGRALLRYLERLVSHDGALRLLADVRTRVFTGLIPLVPSGVNLRRGDLLRRFVTDVDGVQEGLVRAVVPLIGAAITAVGAVGLAVALVPSAGWVLAAAVAVGLVLAPTLARVVAGSGDRAASLSAARDSTAMTLVDGLAELTVYGADGDLLAEVTSYEAQLRKAARRSAAGTAIGVALGGAAAALALPLVLMFGARAAGSGHVSGIGAAVLIACVLAAFDAAAGVSAAYGAWSRFRSGLSRITSLLATPVPVPEPSGHVTLPIGATGLILDGAYIAPAAGAPDAVVGATFSVQPGRRVALVGPSGCGKSTLLTAALRLLPVTDGALDLHRGEFQFPLRDISAPDVPPMIAGPLQGDHVFNASLRDNLRIVRPDATDADLDIVAARVGLEAFVGTLPLHWATAAGPDGANLSGGQRQRLVLARALLAAPDVLVLDEPTAHLDVETEQEILADLLAATRGQTILMSTHRALPEGAFDRVVQLTSAGTEDLRPLPRGPFTSAADATSGPSSKDRRLTKAGTA